MERRVERGMAICGANQSVQRSASSLAHRPRAETYLDALSFHSTPPHRLPDSFNPLIPTRLTIRPEMLPATSLRLGFEDLEAFRIRTRRLDGRGCEVMQREGSEGEVRILPNRRDEVSAGLGKR